MLKPVRKQLLCLQRPLVHLPLLPTPLSVIPFVSTLYQQPGVCGFLSQNRILLQCQVSNKLQMPWSWISLGISKWKFCYSPHFCESFLIERDGGLWSWATMELFAKTTTHHCFIPTIYNVTTKEKDREKHDILQINTLSAHLHRPARHCGYRRPFCTRPARWFDSTLWYNSTWSGHSTSGNRYTTRNRENRSGFSEILGCRCHSLWQEASCWDALDLDTIHISRWICRASQGLVVDYDFAADCHGFYSHCAINAIVFLESNCM